MSSFAQFPYLVRNPALGNASLAPMLPVLLSAQQKLSVVALVDSGAAVNVLPFSVGEGLGFDWNKQPFGVSLQGNLAAVEARGVVVAGVVADFAPVRLGFAWAKTDAVPVLLGQMNFFLEFDICFYRSRTVFEVRPKQTP